MGFRFVETKHSGVYRLYRNRTSERLYPGIENNDPAQYQLDTVREYPVCWWRQLFGSNIRSVNVTVDNRVKGEGCSLRVMGKIFNLEPGKTKRVNGVTFIGT